MTNKSGRLGTEAEVAVVKVFKDAGFRAKRLTLHGNKDVGDIDIGLDSVVVEVKGGKAAETASDEQIVKWLRETETERQNAGADIGILVVKRKGIGYPNAGRWWAILPDADFCKLLGLDGYGTGAPIRLTLEDTLPLLQRLS